MKREIDKIVIHHSAVDQSDLNKAIHSFDENHKRLHEFVNWLGYHIAYHYLIADSWEVAQTRPLNEVWFHASDFPVNKTSIGVCFIGDFDKRVPTEKQYQAFAKLVEELEKQYDLSIHFHNEYAPKTCPGRMFDYNRARNLTPLKNNMAVEKKNAIQKLMVSNQIVWNDADATIPYVNEDTKFKLNQLKKSLEELNNYFRQFWY